MKKSLVTIRVRKGDIGRALKLFKRLVKESEHIQELKKRKEYIKPTTKRRKEKQEAIRENDRMLKELRREGDHQ
jgi:ribosomal protein S21